MAFNLKSCPLPTSFIDAHFRRKFMFIGQQNKQFLKSLWNYMLLPCNFTYNPFGILGILLRIRFYKHKFPKGIVAVTLKKKV